MRLGFTRVIASIDFKAFKILREARIELAPFNLVIGPNGSGKTSVIEAIRRLRSLAALPVTTEPPPEGSRIARLTFGFSPPHAGISVQLACKPDLECDGIRLEGSEQALTGWPALAARLHTIRFHALDHTAMARPSSLDAPARLSEDGSNLAAAMYALKVSDPAVFESISGEFRRILPEFSTIETVASGDYIKLEFGFVGEDHRIGAGDLSQGTIALLGVLFLSAASPRPAMLCIEEIDRGLHPRVLREARDALYRLSHPAEGEAVCQVLATTHSPYLLDLFRDQLEEVIVAEKAGARASFRRLSDLADVKDLLADASLGDLWFSGVLGGVPEEE